MTSKVSVTAHCSESKHVHVIIGDGGDIIEDVTIENGSEKTFYVYDNRDIFIKEVENTTD